MIFGAYRINTAKDEAHQIAILAHADNTHVCDVARVFGFARGFSAAFGHGFALAPFISDILDQALDVDLLAALLKPALKGRPIFGIKFLDHGHAA